MKGLPLEPVREPGKSGQQKRNRGERVDDHGAGLGVGQSVSNQLDIRFWNFDALPLELGYNIAAHRLKIAVLFADRNTLRPLTLGHLLFSLRFFEVLSGKRSHLNLLFEVLIPARRKSEARKRDRSDIAKSGDFSACPYCQ